MKSNFFKMSLFTFLITGVLMSCNGTRGTDTSGGADEDAMNVGQDEARQDSMQYVTYRSEAERRLNENERKIEELKQRQRTESNEIETRYDTEIEELERRNREMRDNISTYQQGGRDRWDSFRTTFEEDMDSLGNSISNFFNRDTTNNNQ